MLMELVAHAPTEEQHLLATLMLFLESLIKETLSKDVIALAMMATKSRAQEMGIAPETCEWALARMLEYVDQEQAANPMSGLF